jgi:hypothetical protein
MYAIHYILILNIYAKKYILKNRKTDLTEENFFNYQNKSAIYNTNKQ